MGTEREVFFAFLSLVLGLILFFDVTNFIQLKGLLKKEETADPTDSPKPDEPDDEEEEDDGPLGTLRVVGIVLLSLGLVAAASYVLYYRLQGFKGYVRYLAKMAWYYFLPAILCIVGIAMQTLDIPLVSDLVANICYAVAGLLTLGLFIKYWFNRAYARYMLEKEKMYKALIDYKKALQDGVQASIDATKERLDAISESLGVVISDVHQSLKDTGQATKDFFFGNISDDMSSVLNLYDVPPEIIVKLKRYKRMKGEGKVLSNESSGIEKEKKAFLAYVRKITKIYAAEKKLDTDQAKKIWEDKVRLGLIMWRMHLDDNYQNESLRSYHDIDEKNTPLYT